MEEDKRKTLRFWVWSEQKSKEMKMAGTRAAERGWPELGFVEVW